MKMNVVVAAGVVALVACGCLCGKPSAGTRVAALPEDAWKESEWLCAADAPVASNADKQANRAAPGTSWFLNEFVNEGDVVKAVWMTTSLGVYEIYVNGTRVGTEILKPGYTHVGKTRYSFTYDVTDLMQNLKGAKNIFAAEVSAGWWRDKIVTYVGDKSAFCGVLKVTYADGSSKLYGTKTATWKAGTAGRVTHAAIFDGEEFDARKPCPSTGAVALPPAVRSHRFDPRSAKILPSAGAEVYYRPDLTLKPVEAYTWKGVTGENDKKDKAKVFGQVVKTRTFDAGDTLSVQPGETLIIDFGQNCAAVPAFKMRATRDAVLTVLPGEMLNDQNGERARGNDGPGGSIYRENLRRPHNCMRAIYTFASDDVETYMPRFTFFGYRYLSITATAPVTFECVKSIPVTSITKEMELGSIKTGNALVNQLIDNVYWGQLSNYLSVPTDCPQRNERLGWAADTHVFAEAGSFNANTLSFLQKWMRDMVDSRDKDGGFPSVAPFAQYGNETFNFGWADAGVIVPWTMWKQFGDKKILADNWEAMAKFVRKIDEKKYDFEEKLKHGIIYADWLSYETYESCGNRFGSWWGQWKNDPNAKNYRLYLAACYWLYDARLMVEMADALGKTAEKAEFEASAKRALAHIRASFVEADGLLLKPMRHLQTACLFALKLGIVEGKAADETKAILLKNIKEHGDCLQTGFLGTSILMDTLTQIGATDVAYTLLLQRKNPSWLYSVDQGATTIWERWNSYTKENGFGPVGMNSFNHYAYGAVLAWIYKTAAGIAATTDDPGFKTIIMAPQPDKRLGSVTAEYKAPTGLIKSAWRYEGDTWIWDFTVPQGSTAKVTLPGSTEVKIYKAGTHHVEVK